MFEPRNIKEYVAEKKAAMKEEVEKLEKKPCLAIIQVGQVEASCRYVKNKIKDCGEVGIEARLIALPEDVPEDALIEEIEKLNHDDSVTGFIVQLPLPECINEWSVVEAIDPLKDIDGFSKRALVAPATPSGILSYLQDCRFEFRDKNAVVIGRSSIVGKPMARLLLEQGCNVTMLHSKTSLGNKRHALEYADLVVVATGHRNTLTDEDLEESRPGCFVVDVGINFDEEGKLCGDCENVSIRRKSPVPGGVGLLTRCELTRNLLNICKLRQAAGV